MSQATFSIRLDEKLKRQFDKLCENFGMNATTAFNVFARAVVRERKIPFEIQAESSYNVKAKGSRAFMALREDAEEYGVQDLSLKEINREIKNSRKGK